MAEFILAHGPSFAYALIVAILALSGAGLPIPEEVPVVAAGILASHGQLDPWGAFLACLVGALVGDSVMYWIGHRFGRGVVREHPWYAHFLTHERESRIERLFQRHGVKLFFGARFLVGLRSPVYLTAGILRIPYQRFLIIDSVCATAVVGTFYWLAFLFGTRITKTIHGVELVATAIVVLAIALWILVWWRRRKHALAAAAATAEALLVADAETPSSHTAPVKADPAIRAIDAVLDAEEAILGGSAARAARTAQPKTPEPAHAVGETSKIEGANFAAQNPDASKTESSRPGTTNNNGLPPGAGTAMPGGSSSAASGKSPAAGSVCDGHAPPPGGASAANGSEIERVA